MKKFDAFQMKMFMAMLMLLDHLDHVPNLISGELAMVFHVLTRCVAVWFAYMLVEGFRYTRSKKKYNIRIAAWALFMLLGNKLIEYLFHSKEIYVHNNIFMTLALSALALNLIYEFTKSNLWMKVCRCFGIILVVFVSTVIGSEGIIPILPFVLITYFAGDKVKLRNILYGLLFLIMLGTSCVIYEDISTTLYMLVYNSDFMFITVIPFINMYSGKRGIDNKFSKYFFYVFYPAHLWLLATIAYFIK